MNHFTDTGMMRKEKTNMSQLFTGQGSRKKRRGNLLLTSEQQFKIEFECEFLGSVDMIAPSKLTSTYENPTQRNAGLDIHETAIKDHEYVITVDARGVSEDTLPLLFLILQVSS